MLEPYGEVDIDLWPGCVTTIPTFDQRVTRRGRAALRPYAGPAHAHPEIAPATPEPTPSGTPFEEGEGSEEPVPSG